MARKPVGAPLLAVAPPSPVSPLASLVRELATLFPEREEHARALVVAAVAGQHAVMLGLPGTAKSALTRALKDAFSASYFELLMTRFTTPEEVYGPVKLSALQADRFERATASYLPSAEIVFLDEVFKANSAILNALLAALNERVFHNDGRATPIPLVSCFAASNELPEGDGELDALYDRFLVRIVTTRIKDEPTFRDLLGRIARGQRPAGVATRVDIRAEQAAARAVVVSDATLDALSALRTACDAAGSYISDRRWIQCLSLLQAAAHVDGRTSTEPDDLEILESVLWRKPDERVNVAKLVQGCVSPDGATAVAELDAARELFGKLPAPGSVDAGAYLARIASAVTDVGQIEARIVRLASGRKVDQARLEVAGIKLAIGKLAARAAGLPS